MTTTTKAPRPTGRVGCFECGQSHVAEFSHFSEFNGEPIYAVVCTEDFLTDYYTTEVVEFPEGSK